MALIGAITIGKDVIVDRILSYGKLRRYLFEIPHAVLKKHM